ncbi:MGC83622 protein, related [Eimeria mitis]|uniref:Hexosyltransferase n=1 Tax=Eimeria mitis TaxID=44415 RepID=U6JY71_9EIME|nr:MGC83622 protein, related [Eimeria mitis]CDJ30359.1 MGC83622 protein, related [Eimeria mitis]
MLSLPLQTNWRLLITPKVTCAEDPPYVVLMAMTGAGDPEGRTVIRSTWGGVSEAAGKRVRLFFLLGTVESQDVQKAVEKEAEEYGDILQHAAPDKYTNLATKAATMIQWMAASCPEAKFLVKADTDTLVNLDVMIPYLIKVENKGDLALGYRLDNMPLITSEKSRNYQDPLVFPRKVFPPYLSGACYIVSGSLIQKVVRVLPEVPRVRNEDTFLGMCLERLGIQPTNIGSEAPISPWFDPAQGPCAAFRLAAAHSFKRDLLVAIWRWWKTGGAKMCH